MGANAKKRQRKEYANNSEAYAIYFNRLQSMATSCFEYSGVPNGCNMRFFEQRLFYGGAGIIFRDEILDSFLSLGANFCGNVDVYGDPIMRYATGYNGAYYDNLTPDNSVLFYNNVTKTPSVGIVKYYADKLWKISRAFDTNISAQRTPVAILANAKQRLTMLNFYEQFDGDQPFIFGDDSIDLSQVKAIKTDAPIVFPQIYQAFTNVYNEFLSVMGIPNISVQKKERLITDEVNRNMGGTIMSRYSRLDERKRGCEQVNKLFGLNMDVKYRDFNAESGGE